MHATLRASILSRASATRPPARRSAGARARARWFAGAFYFFEDPWPETARFDDDAAYRAWLDRIAQNNRLSCPVAPKADDRVLVCCTCSLAPGESDPNAYALFAVIES